MKRISENDTLKIPPVRLHLEDIKHILEMLQKDMSVEIQHQKFSYESLDDLMTNVQREFIDSLSITASNSACEYGKRGYLNITISPGDVSLYGSEQSSERRAHVAEYLRSKVRWYSWKPMESWWHGLHGGLAMLLPFSVAITLLTAFPLLQRNATILLMITALGTGVMLSSDRVWLGGSKIYLYTSFGKPTFWQRNRESVLVGAMSSIVSAVIGYIAGYLSK